MRRLSGRNCPTKSIQRPRRDVPGMGHGSLATEEACPLPAEDWEPLIRCVVEDVSQRTPVALIAARFHNALVG